MGRYILLSCLFDLLVASTYDLVLLVLGWCVEGGVSFAIYCVGLVGAYMVPLDLGY